MSKLRPQDVLRLLKDARPEQVEAVKLPDGSMKIHFRPVKPTPVAGAKRKGKWAQVAEKMAEENLFGNGRGDRLRKAIREFRDSFRFRDVMVDSRKK